MFQDGNSLQSSSSPWHSYRLICINDVYTFDNASGHGGFASAASLINRLRDECGGNCLVTVNGDFLGGSRLAEQTKGRVIIDIMNHMRIDAVVLGNHEFDFSTVTLVDRIKESNFTWLAANVAFDNLGELIPGTIDGTSFVTKDGLRIGLFGVCTPSTPSLSYPCKETVFKDPLECSRNTIARLRKEHQIDLMVGLTHLRRSGDVEISEFIDDVDLLLGGHDHDPFCQFKDHTLIMKCGQNAYWVGVIDITWRRNTEGKVEWYMSWSMKSTAGVEQDKATLDIVERYQKEIEMLNPSIDLDEVILTLTGPALDTRTAIVRVGEATSGNLVADCLFAFFNAHGADPDFGLINGGFIRGDRLYDERVSITRRILDEEMPFPKNACVVEILGVHLRAAIEQMIRDFPHAAGCYPHVSSHVRIQFSRHKPTGSRIVSFTVRGEPLIDNCKYRVATSLFIANGGDSCNSWKCGAVLPELPVRCIPEIVAWTMERRRDQKSSEMQLKLEGRIAEVSDQLS